VKIVEDGITVPSKLKLLFICDFAGDTQKGFDGGHRQTYTSMAASCEATR
jgi:hypothetical protein